jgi:predicted ArsR family transcriptional regulator
MQMGEDGLERQIAGVAALDEPVRRRLYLAAVRAGEGIGRDEAAEALGISRGLAAFHLDKLAAEGLLDVEYRRLTGKTGPGAGRPAKLYRRSRRQLIVTVPPRSYELAARLFARVIAEATPEIEEPLQEVARDFGAAIGEETRAREGDSDPWAATQHALQAYGYEPREDEQGELRLHNCPFHVLAEEHRALVCGMNLHLIQGVLDGLEASGLDARLEPHAEMCCVCLRRAQALAPQP